MFNGLKKFSRFVSLLLLGVGSTLLGPTPFSYARTEICGDGIDNDSSGGDRLCSMVKDPDRDGYYTDGTGYNTGTDCDSTNRQIYPEIYTSVGCSSGEFHKCQSDGTYTACKALSAATAADFGGTALYFYSPDGTTGASGGTFGNPFDWRCISNSSLACYHVPTSGDRLALIFTGTNIFSSSYSDSGTPRHIFPLNKDADNRYIHLFAAPGYQWFERGEGQGVYIRSSAGSYNANHALSVQVVPVQIFDSDNWEVSGLEIDSNGGFNNTGIEVAAGLNPRIYNNYVHDIDGEEDDNLACIKLRSFADGADVHHNRMKDCYERVATTGDNLPGGLGWNSQNNSEFRSMDCRNFHIHDNVLYTTNSSAYGISFKHGVADSVSGRVDHNIIFDVGYSGIGMDGIPNVHVEGNYIDTANQFAESGGISQIPLGGGTEDYNNFIPQFNTIVNGPCFESKASNAQYPFGSLIFDFYSNICIDNRGTSYPSEGEDGFIRINFRGDNALYAAMEGKVFFRDNCYWNSLGTPLFFTYFGDPTPGNLGFSVTGALNWIATTLDNGGIFEDPGLDEDGQATSLNCSSKGWNSCCGGTSVTTTTTLPQNHNGFAIYIQ